MPDFKVPVTYSTSHTVFPRIVLGILAILAVILLIQGILKARKENRSFLSWKGTRFFTEHYDKAKLFGTIIGLVAYILLMPILGFIPASLLFIFFFNVLYAGRWGKKDLAISLSIAAVETMTVWFIFGYLFEITLP